MPSRSDITERTERLGVLENKVHNLVIKQENNDTHINTLMREKYERDGALKLSYILFAVISFFTSTIVSLLVAYFSHR